MARRLTSLGSERPEPEVLGTRASTELDSPEVAPTARPTDSPAVAHDAGRTGIASTRAAHAWIALLPALVVLAVLLIFVLQNTRRAEVSFFTASGEVPLALALFAAFAAGAIVVLLLGSVRILQLRKTIHRREHQD